MREASRGETSVQADATASAVADVITEFRAIRGAKPVAAQELDRAQRSLTRGYVRHFETAANLTNAAAHLAALSLPDDTFDRFVPAVDAVTEADVLAAANRVVRPDECVTVVVGDASACRGALAAIGQSSRTSLRKCRRSMKAVRFHEHGGPEVLRYEDAPIRSRVRVGGVAVRACALNHLDLWQRRGLDRVRIPMPTHQAPTSRVKCSSSATASRAWNPARA